MKKIITLCGMLTLCAGTIFSAFGKLEEETIAKLAEKLEQASTETVWALEMGTLEVPLKNLASVIEKDLAGAAPELGFYRQYCENILELIQNDKTRANISKKRLEEIVGKEKLQAWIEKYTKKIAESAGEQFEEVALEAVNAIAVAPEHEEQIAANFFKQYRKELATLGITTAAGAATFLGIIALLAGSKQDDKPAEEHHPAPSFSDSFEHVVHYNK